MKRQADASRWIVTSKANVLGRRLATTFSAGLLIAIAGSVIGIASLQRVDSATRQAIEQNLVSERLAVEAYRLQAINAERYTARKVVLVNGVQERCLQRRERASTGADEGLGPHPLGRHPFFTALHRVA
jgi:thiol:disulfide interchange protein